MKLTPQDIHHKEFKRGIRGYSEEEVDLFLDQVAEQYENLYKQNHQNDEEIHQLREKLKTYQNMELTLQNTLLTAQKSAEEVQMNAQKEADKVLADAGNKAKRILSNAEKQKQVLSETFAKLKSLDAGYKAKIRENLEGFLGKVNKIDSDEQSLLEELEKEFTKVPDIVIPKVEKTPVVIVETQSEPPAAEKEQPDQKEEIEEAASKADASKSDIGSEEEIDKFLKQENPELPVDNEEATDKQSGLLGRIFKRKEGEETAASDNGNGQSKTEVKTAEKATAKKTKKEKKKKNKKKHTQEIKV